MSDQKALLDEIAGLHKAKNVAALLAYEDHADKQVRKAARKAIHVLRSKGIDVPAEQSTRTWANAGVQDLRRHAGASALLDLDASPAVTRLTLSIPHEEEGALLFIALIDPYDRVIDFGAYMQTDGQQARTVRDWKRATDDRSIPLDWVFARLRWGRDKTFAANLPVPKALDEHLFRFGEVPSERPEPTFLDAALADVEPSAGDLGELLMRGGVHTWPVLFDANALFERLSARMEGVDPATITTEERLVHIIEASAGDAALREALGGIFANALDDVAVNFWLDGHAAEAKRVRTLAQELRGAAEPDKVAGVVNLVQLQITSAAIAQMRQGGHDHDHDHPHGHPGHVHDEHCDHD